MISPRIPRPSGDTRRRVTFVVTALLLLLAACSSDQTSGEPTVDTVILGTDGCAGITRVVNGQPAEVCVEGTPGSITIRTRGLEAGSTVTVTGAGGDSLESDVDSSTGYDITLSGQVVQNGFTVAGTWVDGEPFSMSVGLP